MPALLKIGMVEDVQHFRLENESNIFPYRNVFSDGQVIVPVAGPIQPHPLTDGAWRDIGSDIWWICASARNMYLGLRNPLRSGRADVNADGTLEL